MTIKTTTIQAAKLFNKGDVVSGEVAVPVGVAWVQFGIDRSDLVGTEFDPDAMTIGYAVSQDNGATWPWDDQGSAGFALGILLDGQGQPIIESKIQINIPNPASSTRRIRYTLSINGDGANVGLFVRTGP